VKLLINYSRLLNITYISRLERSDVSSLIIKSLLHYLQIVSLVGLNKLTAGFDVPIGLKFFPNSVGEPVTVLKHSFDCSYSQNTKIPLIYIRVIWGLFVPILYLLGITIIYLVLIALN
jgi:hypothetical protein